MFDMNMNKDHELLKESTNPPSTLGADCHIA